MAPISIKRKFIADGVFRAELNEFLTRELSEDGYSGVEVRVTPTKTEVIISATRTDMVLGEKNRRIRELTSLVQKRFDLAEGTLALYAEKVANRGLCATAQAESLRFKLLGGLAVRRACYGVLRYIMQSGAHGKFIADGVFKAELNEFLTRELSENGYSGVEVLVTPTKTEVIISATRTDIVLGEKNRRIRELTSLVQKRFDLAEGTLALYAEKVANRGLCATAQAESLRFKLLGGLAVRRACYGVLRYIMQSGAQGCEVIISGKLRGQRAKSMKFVEGLMNHSGDPVKYYVDTAIRHVLLRQGVIGIKIKIMLPHDPTGKIGPKMPLPDKITIHDPKEEELPTAPRSEHRPTASQEPATQDSLPASSEKE